MGNNKMLRIEHCKDFFRGDIGLPMLIHSG